MKEKKPKFDNESNLYYRKYIIVKDEQGNIHKTLSSWIRAEGDLDIGSLKEKNNIADIKYMSPGISWFR